MLNVLKPIQPSISDTRIAYKRLKANMHLADLCDKHLEIDGAPYRIIGQMRSRLLVEHDNGRWLVPIYLASDMIERRS
jgi:hypothetical protein